MPNQNAIKTIANLIARHKPDLKITMLEIGARPLESEPEPYWHILDSFPNSRIHAFEVEENLCNELNAKTHSQAHYHAIALGREEENRTFYETNHPMCSSLYEPNEELLKLYHSLDVSLIKKKHLISTKSLDNFAAEHQINKIDFIKVDIQGAELELFQNGLNALQDTTYIVTETEFIELYKGQPLFKDIDEFLSSKGFMLQKISNVGRSCLKPVQVPITQAQLMWSDAMYIPHILTVPNLDEDKLLKLALFSFIYDSPDLTYHCFSVLDKKFGSNLTQELEKLAT